MPDHELEPRLTPRHTAAAPLQGSRPGWSNTLVQMDHLNKSGVQEIAAFGGAPDELVPSAVARALAERTAS
jgi:hypothetical protein